MFGMAEAAQDSRTFVVRSMTTAVQGVVTANGARYHIKARGTRQPIRLEARSDVKLFRTRNGSNTPTGAVRGIPAGFWSIVEYGSYRHLITSTKGRGGKERVTSRGRTVRFLTVRKTTKIAAGGKGSLGVLGPLLIPGIGYRQWVMHPGHSPIGKPWATAMLESEPVAHQINTTATAVALVRKFT
jgi:hypothetical protein